MLPYFQAGSEMIVTFDVDKFRSRYPDLADISDATLESCFEDACAVWGNTDETSQFEYDPENGKIKRRLFLYSVTCHLATLQKWGKNGQQGRLTSASQGSVSTSFDLLKTNKFTGDWWCQTQCGAFAWYLLQAIVKGGRFYGFSHNHPFG